VVISPLVLPVFTRSRSVAAILCERCEKAN
jgi:hypothetical protein